MPIPAPAHSQISWLSWIAPEKNALIKAAKNSAIKTAASIFWSSGAVRQRVMSRVSAVTRKPSSTIRPTNPSSAATSSKML